MLDVLKSLLHLGFQLVVKELIILAGERFSHGHRVASVHLLLRGEDLANGDAVFLFDCVLVANRDVLLIIADGCELCAHFLGRTQAHL